MAEIITQVNLIAAWIIQESTLLLDYSMLVQDNSKEVTIKTINLKSWEKFSGNLQISEQMVSNGMMLIYGHQLRVLIFGLMALL